MFNRKIGALGVAVVLVLGVSGCTKEADNVNKNLSTDADNFKIAREVTAINGITDKIMLQVSGLCSVDNSDPNRYSITCKVGKEYTRDFIGKSDNVTLVTHQLEATNVSTSAYRFVLRPASLIPEVTTHTP